MDGVQTQEWANAARQRAKIIQGQREIIDILNAILVELQKANLGKDKP